MRKLSVGLGVIAMGALGMSLQAGAADVVVTIDGGVVTSPSEGQCLAAVPLFTQNDCSYNDDGSVVGGVTNWIGPGLTGTFYDLDGAPAVLWTSRPDPDTDGREGIALSGTITIDDKDAPTACSTHELSGVVTMAPFDRHYQTQSNIFYVDRFPNGITQTIAKKQVDGGTANGAGGCDYVLGSAGAPNIITGPGGDPFPGRIEYVTTTTGSGTTQWTAPGTAGLATFESNTGFAATAAIGAGYSCTRSTGDCTTAGFSTVSLNTDDKASWKNIVGTISTDSGGSITASTLFLVHELPVVGVQSWLAYTASLTGTGPGGASGNAVDDTATTAQDTAVVIDVLANDTNFSDPVTVTIASNGTDGNAVVNNSPGNQAVVDITYTPDAGFFGSDSFTYTVDDGTYTDTATVTVTVFEVGANDDTASTQLNTPVLIDVLANDVGFGDPVTVTITLAPDAGGTAEVVDTNGDPVAGGTGNRADLRIRFTPDAALLTPAYEEQFTYQVSSSLGGGGPQTYTLDTIVQTVPFGTASPDGPISGEATVDGSDVTATAAWQTIANVNAAVDYSGSWATTIGESVDLTKEGTETCVDGVDTAGPSRICGDGKAWTNRNGLVGDWISGFDMNGDASALDFVNVTVGDGTLTIRRSTRFIDDPASFFFTQPQTIDFNYTADAPAVVTESAVVTVTVNNVIPVANDGTTSTSTQGVAPASTSATLNAATLAGNNLGDAPAVVTAGNAVGGSVSVSGTTVTYTPAADNFVTGGSFDYTITDNDGEAATGSVTVTIADVAPTLANGNATGNQGAAVNAQGAFTAGNGSVGQHTLAVQTQALNGSCAATVSGSNVVVAYTPNSGYTGTDSCVVRLTDGDGDADDGTFSYTINATGGGGGGGGSGISLPGGSGAVDPWSLLLLGGLPLLRRRRD